MTIYKNDIAPIEQKDRDFLSLLDIKQFKKYYKESFLSLAEQIRRGIKEFFIAVKVLMQPNRYNPDNLDIIATSSNGEKVYQYDAFPDGASARQLKKYVSKCSIDHPMKIKAKPSKPYGDKIYINMYDPSITVTPF